MASGRPNFFQIENETKYEFMDEVCYHSNMIHPLTGQFEHRTYDDIVSKDQEVSEGDDPYVVNNIYVKALGSVQYHDKHGASELIQRLKPYEFNYDALFRVGNVVDYFETLGRQTITLDNSKPEIDSTDQRSPNGETSNLNDLLKSPGVDIPSTEQDAKHTVEHNIELSEMLDIHADSPMDNIEELLAWIHSNSIVNSATTDKIELEESVNSARAFGDTMSYSRYQLYSLKLLQYQIVYITNTESIPISDYSSFNSDVISEHEVMLLPCSGLHQFYHILRNPNCKRVIWYDFNPYSVEWIKYLINNFNGSSAEAFDTFVRENRKTITADGVILDDNIEYDLDNVEEFFNVHFDKNRDNEPYRVIGKSATQIEKRVYDKFRVDISDVDSWRSELGQASDDDEKSGERAALSGDSELGKQYWTEQWDRIKSIKHEFACVDAVKDWQTLADLVGVNSKVFIQLTNIWQYEVNYLNTDHLDSQLAFLNLINTIQKRNKSLHFTGDTPGGIHYRNKNIAELKGIY